MEELLKELLSEVKELRRENQEIKLQNHLLKQTLHEELQPLHEEITELKQQQAEMFKKFLEMSEKERVIFTIEKQFDALLERVKNIEETQDNAVIVNQHRTAEFLQEVAKKVLKDLKESKEKEEAIVEKGEKILEVLDDIGNAIVNTQKSILNSNSRWGKGLLERLDKLAIGIAGLANRIDYSEQRVIEHQNFTYDKVKELDNTIHRKLW